MTILFVLAIYIFFLPLIGDACIPTQNAEINIPTTTTRKFTTTTTITTTTAPVCVVCTNIYKRNGNCPLDPSGYGSNPAICPDVPLNYKRGQLADGYGNAETCSIEITCPSGYVGVYIYPDNTESYASGSTISATCSETAGTWYEEETTMVVQNIVCRDS